MADDDLIIDGYKLNPAPIASGNSSEIYEVVEQSGGQSLCMKLLLPEAMGNPTAKAVLKHEAKVAKAFDHPNIIKVHKVSVSKKHAYILMDYFRAPNIKTAINSDLVGLHMRFRKVFESICLALGYVHEKGWVHKDVKPENILANKVGELRLIDFSLSVRAAGGLGKLLGSRSKAVQGTKTYIAPETLLKKASTPQTDMYSLGITVFEMLTGSPPFRGMSPADLLRMHVQEKPAAVSFLNKNVTPEMDRLVDKLLKKKPADRHKTMEEVYAEFRALKVFVEDPKDLDTDKREKRKQADMHGLGGAERINSRRDHLRSEAGLNEPPKPAPPKAETPKPQPAPPRQPAPKSPPAPVAGPPMPGQGYGPPGAPYSNYPPPPTGYGFPPGMQPPPGYPYPQMPPGYPPQGPLPPGYVPPGVPMQPPVAPTPAPAPKQQTIPKPEQPSPSPAATNPAPTKPATKPTKKQEEEDLPLMEMDELPDVL